MRLILLTALTMVAFALNSVLNRAAVDGGHATAAGFAIVRVFAGVVILTVLVRLRAGGMDLGNRTRWMGALALAAYMIGFSLAYVTLDAGLGALILFGTVQIALFLHTALTGAAPTARQIFGAALAFVGLSLALWPEQGAEAGSAQGAVLMVVAGMGWAAYTVAGRGAADPLAATATHFLLCLPLVLLLFLVAPVHLTATGWALAILGGAVTSGLGYALWYHVLPALPGASAAVVQLSVPVIAIILGALILSEPIALRTALAAALVLGGIGFALTRGVSAPAAPARRK
ncbi:DMT family transporter [Aliishimia ponticola]|uniref:DMT family transporter n=1 Tax=Aliishimia ponticola TaxID=2499833 RepID=A0A4S4NC41_9RHOB|nr:DMT family transporter [Aliishimia ponticola]THH36986.1 DMT family transporter [Aliishimia ponticola]